MALREGVSSSHMDQKVSGLKFSNSKGLFAEIRRRITEQFANDSNETMASQYTLDDRKLPLFEYFKLKYNLMT